MVPSPTAEDITALEAVPKALFSNHYVLRAGERLITELQVSAWRERAEFNLGTARYCLRHERFIGGDFLLEADRNVLIRANQPKGLRDKFTFRVGERAYVLERLSFWRRIFGLFENDHQVGFIAPASALTRRAEIHLPSELPAVAQVFVFWLALVAWNRMSGGD
jgi:hypothetical protein